jgi:hypothetical protein
LNRLEERIRELEVKKFGIIQSGTQKEKRLKKNEHQQANQHIHYRNSRRERRGEERRGEERREREEMPGKTGIFT